MAEQIYISKDRLPHVRSVEIYFDAGTRRGNPGPSGIAVYFKTKVSGPANFSRSIAEFVGDRTNNEAEWLALIKALEVAVDYLPDLEELAILSDSKLVVRQARGEWQVRGNLKPLHARAAALGQELVDRGCKVTIGHVPRAQNAEADRLVTELLDGHLGRRRGY